MTTKMRISLFFFLISFVSANLYAQVYTWESFPQMAAGGNYTTYLTINDPLQDGISRYVEVIFYKPTGEPLNVTVDRGIGTVSWFGFYLPDLGEVTFTITSSTIVTGRIEIAAEGVARFNASLRYATKDSTGKLTDVVGILPVNPNYSWTIGVNREEEWQHIGVAIANWEYSDTDDFSANVQFSLYQNSFQVDTTKTINVPELGQLALYVDDERLFPEFFGEGTLRVSCPEIPIAVMAMRDDGAQFSSLPADAGTQLWSWSYTTDSSTTYTGYWSWRFMEYSHFYGEEQHFFDARPVGIRIRGTYDTSFNPFPFFILEWWYVNSNTDPGDQGTVLFQGTPSIENGYEVINGTRVVINAAGATGPVFAFKATRVY